MSGAVLLLAGAAVSAAGAMQQGAAAAQQARAQQDLLNQNAELARRQANAEREAASDAAQQFEKEGRRFSASQRIAFARGGVLSTEGTPLLVLEETIFDIESDRLNILKEGFLRGSFRESEAFGLQYQGAAAKAAGKNIQQGSYYAAGGSLLTGAAGAYSATRS